MALLAVAAGAAVAVLAGAGIAHACASHGTNAGNEIQHWVLGDLDQDGLIEAFVGIEDEIVPPTASTVCVCGLGLGTSANRLPLDAAVTSARVVVLNVVSRDASDLPAFDFAANANATAALEVGSGPGGAPDGQPLFEGSTWFGFAAAVDPFVLPALSANEILVLAFDLDLPASGLPLSIEAQFAAGEGASDGTPIFSGEHPTRYFSVDDAELLFVPEPPMRVGVGVALAAMAWLGGWARSRR
jgi:hypothetical protein